MCKLMPESEHLRSLSVCTVDEDERRILIDQRKTTELVWVEFPVRVISYDAIHDGQDSGLLDQRTQQPKSIAPRRNSLCPVLANSELLSNGGGHLDRVCIGFDGGDKGKRARFGVDQILAKPLLTSLHGIDRVKELRTRRDYYVVVD